jgi:hypothetical protein
MPAASDPLKRMAIICVVAFVAVNAAFYVLSGSYFESHVEIVPGIGSRLAYSPEQMTHVRMAFALCTGVIAAFGFVAGLAPRAVGHLIPVVLCLGYLTGAFAAFTRGAPAVVGVTLLVAGLLLPTLAHFSFRGSRSAWAFLIAMCGVFALIGFFGAPKVRDAVHVSLWTAMILPGINAVAAAALASLRRTYVERSVA